jgi:hypothetical protein
MSSLHHASDRFSLRTPLRASARWAIVLNVIASTLDALKEAGDMRRAAQREYPFNQE